MSCEIPYIVRHIMYIVAHFLAFLALLLIMRRVLKNANIHGLIHLCLYIPDHKIYALCSCCSCCCHELQIIKTYDRPELMVHSEYYAHTDPERCIHCGNCVGRCLFEARKLIENRVVLRQHACVGCGLCVPICSTNALSLIRRP